ncbi:MAG: hypothetical protein NC393_14800 [Clostridium sp.]|nr:hypothetical protein [Clostridium sp.]MCM1173377.1 hypothetical protein [Clostridium sp.]
MGKDIAYQNKDIISKVFAENLKEKSFKAYGLDIPKIVQVLPTNLPEITANELRIDNLFLLEDGTIAIVDYESEYKTENKIKYISYITRVLERYRRQEIYDIQIRMIVIYTADVSRAQTEEVYDTGAFSLHIEEAFLSELDSEEIKKRLTEKIQNKETLTDEELMEFIILPLTYKTMEEKRKAINASIELAKQVTDVEKMVFLLSGTLVFTDKVIDRKTSNYVREWINMTQVGRLFEEEKQQAVKQAVMQAVKVAFGEGEFKRLITLVCRKLRKSKEIDIIADELEEDIEVISEICKAAEPYAPEYNEELVYEAYKEQYMTV